LCQRQGSSKKCRSQSATRRAKRVGGEHEVRARGLARLAEARGVGLGGEPADLELHAGERALAQHRDLLGDAERAVVVAADRDHRERVAVAAPQPPQRLAERLADRVPDRRVDAGGGDQPEPPVAQDVERHRSGEIPAALGGERVLAHERGRDLVADDRVDLEQPGVLVAGVGLADHPFARVDARDDRRAMGHLVVAAAVDAAQRDPDRERLDALDRQVRHRSGAGNGGD
jgi:hypothetical protein